MRACALRRSVPIIPFLLLACWVRSPRAGGIGVSDPPDTVWNDTTLVTSGAGGIETVQFNLYKPRADRAPRGFRDFDFLWSDTYRSLFHAPLDSLSGVEQINDLQRLAETMSDLPFNNPFGLPWTDIQVVYNMLGQQENYRDAEYNADPEALVGFRVAQPNYPDPERTHLDAYIYARNFPQQTDPLWPSGFPSDAPGHPYVSRNYGIFPSAFTWANEDSLTGNFGNPLPLNAISIPGPAPSGVASTGPNRWTRPGGTANAGLSHEGLHAINNDASGYLHMFASGAEVVSGVSTDAPRFDVDYHYSLSPSQSNAGNSYPHWQSFMAYLAFNWRGTDTTRAGWQDDLLVRWSKAPAEERDLLGLARRLLDSECPECASYPGFMGLDSLARVQRLIHDWRVANYVNNSTLAGGKYGYPPEFGFSPANQLGAWQDIDTTPQATNSVAIPPIITMGQSPATRSQWFTSRPGGPGFGPRLLEMQMYGAEYFIFQAAPALGQAPRKLVVRVRPGLVRRHYVHQNLDCTPRQTPPDGIGRLHATVVTYSEASDSLFRHPEWATGVYTQSAVLDSVRGDLDFEIQGFCAGTKAVLLVVSLGDGPTGQYSITDQYIINPEMKLELGAFLDEGNVPVVAQPAAATTIAESDAAWSPDGGTLAFRQVEPDGSTRIHVRAADGTGATMPLRSATEGQAEPAWSPRGDRVAYVEGTTLTQVWTVSLVNGTVQLVVADSVAVHEPTWSPDGGRLAYVTDGWVTPAGDPDPPPQEGDLGGAAVVSYRTTIRVRNLATGADTLLAYFVTSDSAFAFRLRNLRWTKDSGFLTFSRFDNALGRYRPYQLDMRTHLISDFSFLAPGARSVEFPPGAGPILLDETAGIAYQVDCDGPAYLCGCVDTAIAAADWMALRDTTEGISTRFGFHENSDFTDLRWSPDGTRVAYTTTQNGNPDVYVVATTLDRAPLLSSLVLPSYTATTCNPFEVSLAASDPDGDPVTFRAFGLPPGATLQNGFRVYWSTPVVGEHWFTVQALDPTGAVATRLIHLSVYDGGDCGSGGGGEGEGEIIPHGGNAAQLAGPTRVIGPGAAGPRAVNSFLDGATAGQWVEQTARLSAARTDESGRVTVGLVGLRPGEFRLDRVRLLAVDHDPARVPVVTDAGVALAERRAPAQVVASSGGGVAEGLVPAGTTVVASWTDIDSLAGLLLDCARAGAVDTLPDWGVQVEVRDGEGWRALEHLRPRSGYDILAVPLEGATEARVRFLSDTYVRQLAGYSLAGTPAASVVRLPCSGASLDGALAGLAEAEGNAVTLVRGQGVTLSFDGPPETAGMQRTLFLEMVASFTPGAPAAAQSRLAGTQATGRYMLHPSLPNPFERVTSIRFEVPRTGAVRVEVYDAQGRRVRTLADGVFPPGVHALDWDGAGAGGRRMGPGVYLVRMTAEGFRAERRVVRLGH